MPEGGTAVKARRHVLHQAGVVHLLQGIPGLLTFRQGIVELLAHGQDAVGHALELDLPLGGGGKEGGAACLVQSHREGLPRWDAQDQGLGQCAVPFASVPTGPGKGNHRQPATSRTQGQRAVEGRQRMECARSAAAGGALACSMSCGSARMRAAMEAPWRGGLLYICRAVIFSWLSTFLAAAASCTTTAGRQQGRWGVRHLRDCKRPDRESLALALCL